MSICGTKDFSLHGTPSDFYIYNHEVSMFSGWIKGEAFTFYDLKNLYKKDKKGFNEICELTFIKRKGEDK